MTGAFSFILTSFRQRTTGGRPHVFTCTRGCVTFTLLQQESENGGPGNAEVVELVDTSDLGSGAQWV